MLTTNGAFLISVSIQLFTFVVIVYDISDRCLTEIDSYKDIP